MLISLFLLSSYQVILEQCSIPDDGLVLSEYYQKWCPACQKLEPVLEEIDNVLERSDIGLTVQKIDCGDCKCDDIDIKSYPTAILRDSGKEIARFTGYKTFKEVGEFLSQHTNISSTIFKDHVEAEADKLFELTSSNMYQGLDGPWMVYFYYKSAKPYEDLMLQLQKIYGTKINFAKISYKESSDFITQFNIKSYPAFYGIYNGLHVPFLESLNLNDLSKFCDTLIEPSFKNLTYEQFRNVSSLLNHGEPIYMVFHNDIQRANQYFAEYAHKYKYKAKIYRTEDKKLFDIASIHPASKSNAFEANDTVKFGVYKDGRFYEYKGDLTNEDEVATWIFHTHFNYVTEIRNSTFSTVFNGYKPVMLLVTKNEQFLREFNAFSADRHLGTPYIDIVFAAIDANVYSNFIPSLLPNLEMPALVIYDPIHKVFRHKKLNLTPKTFSSSAISLLKLYEQNKLSIYPPTKSYRNYYILGAGFVALALFAASRTASQTKTA